MAPEPNVDTLFESAERARQEGRLEAALADYDKVLARAPAHVGALYRKALLAFQANRLAESAALLRDACAAKPDNAELNFYQGFVLLAAGREQEALVPLERASVINPQWYAPHLKLGVAHLVLGQRDQAQQWFQRALMADPGLRAVSADESKPAALREEVRAALQLVAEREWAIVGVALEAGARADPAADLSRLERGFRIQCGREARVFNHPLRQPKFLYLPDLPATPWFEREHLDWVPTVEQQLPAVREELEALIREEAEFVPYISEDGGESASGTDFSGLAGSMEWSAFYLIKDGIWLEDRCRRCPRTTELMRAVPAARMRGFGPEVIFSRLQAGGHIVPHFGRTNVRLTVHLGVIIPDQCAIRVADEIRGWQEGRVLLFDDSFEHEAWNRSDRDRSVLIFEVWHPALNTAEIVAIERYFDARRQWFDLCKPTASPVSDATPSASEM
jgi:aspartyl/asparaginyl beta-hydroxylase (cupin superfamily)